jgi:L-lactate dehydrogenase complex protein LldF
MLNRGLMNSAGAGIKNKLVNKLFKNNWVDGRGELEFAPKTFNQMWKERDKR